MKRYCPLSIHQGRRVKVVHRHIGVSEELICSEAGGILGCGFHIKRAFCTREEWEQYVAWWGNVQQTTADKTDRDVPLRSR